MRRFAAALVLFLAANAFAADGVEEYLNGLDAIEAGKFEDAASGFQKAIDADDENADFRIAYGVALTLGEKLPEAEKALNRALKLSNNADEARLWLATCIAMQGDFTRGTDIYPFAIARNEYVNEIRRMSHEYGQAAFALETAKRNGNNQWDVEYANQELAKRDKLRPTFPRFGASFAQKMKSKLPANQRRAPSQASEGRTVSDALVARIKANVEKQDYAAALRDLNPLLAGNLNDPQLLAYHGICTLNVGAPEIARRQLTRAIYLFPLEADLYAYRAVAAAQTGDSARASSDLQTAKALGSKSAGIAEVAISAAPRAQGAPAELLTGLFEAARAGEPYPSLVAKATNLILAQNAVRRRLDETYTDQLRDHQLAVTQNPNDATRLAGFAAFLYDNAVAPRGEAVELRADWRPYRPVDDAMLQRELDRALALADKALAIDAGNVSAMITKAAVLVNRLQLADAERFLNTALAAAPTEPRLLQLFAEVADRAAAAKQAQANALRTPTTWEDTLYIYTRYPSPAERAAADQLEAQANRLWTMAREALNQAIAQAGNSAEGAYLQAVLSRREGRGDAALVSARRAVELEPQNLRYLDMVTTLLAQSGQKVEALLSQAVASNLVHSTAGPALKCVWFSLPRTKFKTSREYLATATKCDAADPRIAAYYGAVAGADEKADIAATWYAVACALYEADARLEGVSTDSKVPAPLRADVAATMMNVNLRAIALLRATRPQDAERLARSNLAMEPRIDSSTMYTPVPASMLPDIDADRIPVPSADHPGYLLSVSRLELGKVLLANRKYDEAIAQLNAVQSYREKVPPTVDAGATRMNLPIAASRIYVLSALLAKGDDQAAMDQVRYLGRPSGLDQETMAEYQRVVAVIEQKRQGQRQAEDDAAIRRQQEAMDAAMRERQKQIEEIERRRRRPN